MSLQTSSEVDDFSASEGLNYYSLFKNFFALSFKRILVGKHGLLGSLKPSKKFVEEVKLIFGWRAFNARTTKTISFGA